MKKAKQELPEEINLKEQQKNEKKKKKQLNRELSIVTYIFVGLFICLMGYFVYYNAVEAPAIINSSYNKRQDLFARRVIRGDIRSADGKVLAETKTAEDGTESRNYPYANIYAHVVGFSTKGKSGLESLMNFNLLRSNAPVYERVLKELMGHKNTGDNVITTLNSRVQEAAWEALGNNRGAVVAIEAATGKILAMVSKPDFDPNQIDAVWDSLVDSSNEENSTLLNRASQGLYPPGSIFKIMTLLQYIRENPDYHAYSYDCTGKITVDNSTINCYHNTVHGTEDLFKSFAKSCNASFAHLGMNLDIKSFTGLCESFLFNKPLPYTSASGKSMFSLTPEDTTYDIMQTMIGQGETLVSPLHMALITAAIANDGVLMKPYLVDHMENYEGKTIKTFKPSEYGQLISAEEAGIMQEFMQNVVEAGTAAKLIGLSYTVAGKTGSAEYGSIKGQSHAWFVGFSPAREAEIAVSIIVEGAGSGSEAAVPAARKIFDAYYAQTLD